MQLTILKRADRVSNKARETLRAALNPKSVAIVGASDNPNKIGGSRGHVTGVAGRLREARQATASTNPDCAAEDSRREQRNRRWMYAAVARGHVTGVAGRLREARQRAPDNRQDAANDLEEGRPGE